MNEFLEQLFHSAKVKEFVALIKKVPEQYETPERFLEDAAAYLSVRLYEHHYEDTVPHSLFGLASASLAQALFSEEERWRPFVQQAWFATRERKRTPWDPHNMESRNSGTPETRWDQFERAAAAGNFQQAFGWAKGFLTTEDDRDFFRDRSLSYAMDDTSLGGHKFLYLTQAWRLAEQFSWKDLDTILFPSLHFMVMADQDDSLSRVVKEQWRKNPRPSLLANQGQLTEPAYESFEKEVLFGAGPEQALQALDALVQSGAGVDAVGDALLLSAAQALSNARMGSWIWPMRAFHFAYFCRRWIDRLIPHRKTYPLMMSTALTNRSSLRSREATENRKLDEVAERLCPTDTFNVLKSVISHSDPFASATAVYTILAMDEEKREALGKTLMSLAVKNDGSMCYGNDLLFVYEAVDSYKQSSSTLKDNYLVCAGFFLGRAPKKYELFGEYRL